MKIELALASGVKWHCNLTKLIAACNPASLALASGVKWHCNIMDKRTEILHALLVGTCKRCEMALQQRGSER